jgi:serine/threonine protein kinase
MSSQQLDGKRPKVTDDIYSVGATFYDLLTSKPPFFQGDISYQVRHTEVVSMEERLKELELANDIPGYVSAIVMACLQKDPARRPQSLREVRGWIEYGQSSKFSSPQQRIAEPLASEIIVAETLDASLMATRKVESIEAPVTGGAQSQLEEKVRAKKEKPNNTSLKVASSDSGKWAYLVPALAGALMLLVFVYIILPSGVEIFSPQLARKIRQLTHFEFDHIGGPSRRDSTKDFQIHEGSVTITPSSVTKEISYVTGSIQNISSADYTEVTVNIGLYDAGGTLLDHAIDYTNRLGANQIWTFKAALSLTNTASAKVVSVIGVSN